MVAVLVILHLVEDTVVEWNIDITIGSHKGYREVVGIELLVAVYVLERINDTVSLTVDDEEAAIVHLHPDILPLVNGSLRNTVVHALDTAGNTCPIGVEIVAVETHHSVPCGYPHVTIVITGNRRNGIAGQSILGSVV